MHEDVKLREAAFYLDRMATEADNPHATRYHASAFLSAARSVLQYALEEARSKPGGQKWYESQVATNAVVKFMKDARDTNIHERPLPMHTSFSTDGSDRFSSTSTSDVFPPTLQAFAFEYRFKGWSGPEDALALCQRYRGEIERMVADGRTKGFLTP